jgi:ArsR family transcriptional regulator
VIARMADAANALSDPIRLQMLSLLSQCEDLCTCEFSELLELGQSKVSYHLNILLQAGLVSRENHGTWSHYRLLSPQVLEQLQGWIQEEVVPV